MSNFSFLQDQFPLLAELGEKGEHYLYTDPNACLFKLRFLGEKVVELMFQYDKEPDPTDHSQVQRIRYLEAEDYLPRTVADSLTVLRKVGNKAVHDNYASERDAGLCLQMFKAFYRHPLELPDYVLKRYCRLSDQVKDFNRDLLDDDMIEKMQHDGLFIRLIADHIGGMTDQFASRTVERLYYPDYI